MHYFVTGATGFIGRRMVKKLLQRKGAVVHFLVRRESEAKVDRLREAWGVGPARAVPVFGDLTQEKLGELDTELVEHWFHSIGQTLGITLHMELLYGQNNHHICEAAFKGFARAMRAAVEIDPRKGGAIPSTKGQLGG